MKYKKFALCAVIIIFVAVLLIAFFCFVAFSTSYGYSRSNNKNASPVASFSAAKTTTIIVDAGHGGIDPGAIANNVIEKDVNLAVAKKLYDYLAISGYNVVLTRDDDVSLADDSYKSYKRSDLEHRLALIESTDNCIFVSIHMNKFEQTSARGLQSFYSSNNQESSRLAECIQTASKAIDPGNTRGIKPDGGNIFILQNTYKPAVLIECGFLSNVEEAKKLSNSNYQNMLAFVIYGGIMNYLGE